MSSIASNIVFSSSSPAQNQLHNFWKADLFQQLPPASCPHFCLQTSSTSLFESLEVDLERSVNHLGQSKGWRRPTSNLAGSVGFECWVAIGNSNMVHHGCSQRHVVIFFGVDIIISKSFVPRSFVPRSSVERKKAV